MLTRTEILKNYRQEIYLRFPKRRDAIMNLLDAISSFGHRSRSVVQLSEAPCFERQYSSITDAIADGLPHANWKSIEKKQFQMFFNKKPDNAPCFLLDCTPNPRPFARKLSDRTITHAPNPAPGNKPICVGHQYSCIAMLPKGDSTNSRKWVVPISMERVTSDKKGNEYGMQQITKQIQQLGLEEESVVSVGDSLYGSEACRMEAEKHSYLIHIFRVNSKRNLYRSPKNDSMPTRGRKKVYGDKVRLSDDSSLPQPDQKSETARLSRSGNIYPIKIEAWNDMLIRGSKHYDARKHKLTLLRVRMFDPQGNVMFKRPLWLAVLGQCREQLSLIRIYNYYASRYNIEHFFRFGKNNLLLDEFQTYDVEHEEQWWRLCMLSYNQLYLAKSLVSLQVKPWEKYLPKNPYNPDKEQTVLTPSQTQRGFATLLTEIGTPAAPCVPRGRVSGRKKGMKTSSRPAHPVIFKTAKDADKENFLGSEKHVNDSNTGKIQALLRSTRTRLDTLHLSVVKFTRMLCDTG